MKVRATRATLVEALATVRPSVRSTAPFVVLQLTPSGLMVATDNWDVQIRTTLADVWSGDDEAPAVAVPHRPLAEVLAHLDTDEVEIVDDEYNLKVRSGQTDLTLPLADAPLPERQPPDQPPVTIPAEDWEVIQKLTAYCSNDQNRPILQNVFFEDDLVAATDTFRMAVYHYDSGITAQVRAEMIPKVPEGVTEVSLAADERSIQIVLGDTITHGRTIAGDAPKWRILLQDREETSFTVATHELTEALARVQVPAREAVGGGRVVIFEPVEANSILLSSDSVATEMLGHCEELIGIVAGALPYRMAMNSRLLTEAVQLVGGDEIQLRISSPRQPIALGRDDLRVLVMPTIQ